MADRRYTTSTAFLETLREAGVRYLFANGRTVKEPAELPEALKEALAAVHGGRSAVLSARAVGLERSHAYGVTR